MYNELVTSQDQALCHLYFHCSLKDGKLSPAETDGLADRFVALGMQKRMNFKNEMNAYRSYKNDIIDEHLYLEYLIQLINPTNELDLYSYCVELTVSDELMDIAEESLVKKIALILNIDEEQQQLIKKLMVERKVVEMEKII
jgi:uncharacterized tellurite resistance protein B-like protein